MGSLQTQLLPTLPFWCSSHASPVTEHRAAAALGFTAPQRCTQAPTEPQAASCWGQHQHLPGPQHHARQALALVRSCACGAWGPGVACLEGPPRLLRPGSLRPRAQLPACTAIVSGLSLNSARRSMRAEGGGARPGAGLTAPHAPAQGRLAVQPRRPRGPHWWAQPQLCPAWPCQGWPPLSCGPCSAGWQRLGPPPTLHQRGLPEWLLRKQPDCAPQPYRQVVACHRGREDSHCRHLRLEVCGRPVTTPAIHRREAGQLLAWVHAYSVHRDAQCGVSRLLARTRPFGLVRSLRRSAGGCTAKPCPDG